MKWKIFKMSSLKRIAKNTGVTFLGNNAFKILSLVLVIFIARYLGSESFGRFSFALSFTGLFAIIIDLGTRLVLVRETTKSKKDASKFLSNTLFLKLFSTIITLSIIFILINVLKYDNTTKLSVIIASFGLMFNSMTNSVISVYQAFEKMEYSALVKIGKVILRFLFTMSILLIGLGLTYVLIVYSLIQLFGFLISLFIYNKKISKLVFNFDKDLIFRFLKSGFPFLLSSAFVEAYFRIDITLMSKMAPKTVIGLYNNVSPEVVIGWYSAAYSILDSLISIPNALSVAMLPVLVLYFKNNRNKLKDIYNHSIKYLSFISIPASFALTLLADKVIFLLYGTEYSNSIIALKILIWTLIPLSINYMMGALLIALHKEVLGVYILFLNALLNILLNIYFIPKYSHIGAAFATVISEIFYFSCYYLILLKEGYGFNILKFFIKPIISSLLMIIIIKQFITLHVLFLVPIGFIVYLLSLFTLKSFNKEDIIVFRKILKKNL
jgi:O-antigen/teichoic acid export membrane protein